MEQKLGVYIGNFLKISARVTQLTDLSSKLVEFEESVYMYDERHRVKH